MKVQVKIKKNPREFTTQEIEDDIAKFQRGDLFDDGYNPDTFELEIDGMLYGVGTFYCPLAIHEKNVLWDHEMELGDHNICGKGPGQLTACDWQGEVEVEGEDSNLELVQEAIWLALGAAGFEMTPYRITD